MKKTLKFKKKNFFLVSCVQCGQGIGPAKIKKEPNFASTLKQIFLVSCVQCGQGTRAGPMRIKIKKEPNFASTLNYYESGT
jgi:Zn ribbon nucleic-acid-binding protein